jgi:hypothetical protein
MAKFGTLNSLCGTITANDTRLKSRQVCRDLGICVGSILMGMVIMIVVMIIIVMASVLHKSIPLLVSMVARIEQVFQKVHFIFS